MNNNVNQIEIYPSSVEKFEVKKVVPKDLMLYNDEYNSFDFVIETLMDVCEHTVEQAEQCAMITHYKGKCSIKKGLIEDLKPYYLTLLDKGLTVKIH